jgi:hypothetical protein
MQKFRFAAASPYFVYKNSDVSLKLSAHESFSSNCPLHASLARAAFLGRWVIVEWTTMGILRTGNILVSALIGAPLFALSSMASAAGLSVGIDMSTPVRLEKDAASVVVGNPAIADVYIQNGRLVFLQGRSFGTTNLIALDAQGKEIINTPVTVTGTHGQTVTLQRGADQRVTYACAGRCEPSVMQGDDPEHMKAMLDEVNGKTGQADQVATTKTQVP